ncbi:MAG: hypothetical protein WBA41_17480 [Rivularia sp. (in: cyanobacteria)]
MEDYALVKLMKEVQGEKPLSLNEALAELEKE